MMHNSWVIIENLICNGRNPWKIFSKNVLPVHYFPLVKNQVRFWLVNLKLASHWLVFNCFLIGWIKFTIWMLITILVKILEQKYVWKYFQNFRKKKIENNQFRNKNGQKIFFSKRSIRKIILFINRWLKMQQIMQRKGFKGIALIGQLKPSFHWLHANFANPLGELRNTMQK